MGHVAIDSYSNSQIANETLGNERDVLNYYYSLGGPNYSNMSYVTCLTVSSPQLQSCIDLVMVAVIFVRNGCILCMIPQPTVTRVLHDEMRCYRLRRDYPYLIIYLCSCPSPQYVIHSYTLIQFLGTEALLPRG